MFTVESKKCLMLELTKLVLGWRLELCYECIFLKKKEIQSKFNGSNTFGTMKSLFERGVVRAIKGLL